MIPDVAEPARKTFATDESPDAAEAALIADMAAGDEAAFKALYRCYYPRLSRFIGLMTRRGAVIEETVNDTLLVVWRRADRYNRQCKVSTWIFAIAHRTVLKALRQQDEAVDMPSGAEEASESSGPEERHRVRETNASLLRALAALTPEHRSALVLTYFHDLPYAEIAKIVDCPVDTVKTRVFHGRHRLRALLAGELTDWL